MCDIATLRAQPIEFIIESKLQYLQELLIDFSQFEFNRNLCGIVFDLRLPQRVPNAAASSWEMCTNFVHCALSSSHSHSIALHALSFRYDVYLLTYVCSISMCVNLNVYFAYPNLRLELLL